MLILWQFEQCGHSRLVREMLTELGLDFVAINAPPGFPEKDQIMRTLFGSEKTPALWDTQTSVLLQGEKTICEYLEDRYSSRRRAAA